MAAQLDVQSRCSHLQPVMLQDPFPSGRRLSRFPREALAKLFMQGESNVS